MKKLISTVRNTEKSPSPPQNKEESKEINVSTTDPESGYYVKDEREKLFAYSFHTACDSRGFILGSLVTGGNVHDSRMLDQLVTQVRDKVGKPESVAVDAGYKTPHIEKSLWIKKLDPLCPTLVRERKTDILKSTTTYMMNILIAIFVPKDKFFLIVQRLEMATNSTLQIHKSVKNALF